jgi:hypothetical protein
VPNTRSAVDSIACSTPSAVNGLGSPDPPARRDKPVTCVVRRAMVVMSRVEVPTSSAVMYVPPRRSTVSPKSSSTARRRLASSSSPGRRTITPLPPPSGRPATADL